MFIRDDGVLVVAKAQPELANIINGLVHLQTDAGIEMGIWPPDLRHRPGSPLTDQVRDHVRKSHTMTAVFYPSRPSYANSNQAMQLHQWQRDCHGHQYDQPPVKSTTRPMLPVAASRRDLDVNARPEGRPDGKNSDKTSPYSTSTNSRMVVGLDDHTFKPVPAGPRLDRRPLQDVSQSQPARSPAAKFQPKPMSLTWSRPMIGSFPQPMESSLLQQPIARASDFHPTPQPQPQPIASKEDAFSFNSSYGALPRTVLHDPYRNDSTSHSPAKSAPGSQLDEFHRYENAIAKSIRPAPSAVLSTTKTASECTSLIDPRMVQLTSTAFSSDGDSYKAHSPQNFNGPFFTEVTDTRTNGYMIDVFRNDKERESKYEKELLEQWSIGPDSARKREARILARQITSPQKLPPGTQKHLAARALMQTVAENFAEFGELKKQGDPFVQWVEPPENCVDRSYGFSLADGRILPRSQSLFDVNDSAKAPYSAGLESRFKIVPPTPTGLFAGSPLSPIGRLAGFRRDLDGDDGGVGLGRFR